jgi:hypothetical protein
MSARLDDQIVYDAKPSATMAPMAAITVAHAAAVVRVSPPGSLAAPRWLMVAAIHSRAFVMLARMAAVQRSRHQSFGLGRRGV